MRYRTYLSPIPTQGCIHDRSRPRMLPDISINQTTAARLRLDGSGEIVRIISPVGLVGLVISAMYSKPPAVSNAPEKSRAEWEQILNSPGCCATPVLSLTEAPRHPHLVARQTFLDLDGITAPAPAPRFSRTRA